MYVQSKFLTPYPEYEYLSYVLLADRKRAEAGVGVDSDADSDRPKKKKVGAAPKGKANGKSGKSNGASKGRR